MVVRGQYRIVSSEWGAECEFLKRGPTHWHDESCKFENISFHDFHGRLTVALSLLNHLESTAFLQYFHN